MNALKLIYDDLPPVIEMPREYQHHSVQIVITPLTGVTSPDEEAVKKPAPWLARFAGKWQGESLVREDEGCYEVRDELQ
ncbi:MAG: hypothetical protein RRC34_10650 [Lentisphaeria bacterium]|nr:hypothetical protein [Lentisphaeria bacterium]